MEHSFFYENRAPPIVFYFDRKVPKTEKFSRNIAYVIAHVELSAHG